MTPSTAKLSASLKRLQQQRERLLRHLTQKHELAVGAVSVVRRKCGKPNCHCVDGSGHLQTLFLFKDKLGRRRCKLVRRADEERLQLAGRRYREFREKLRQLRAMDRREKEVLVALRDVRALHYD